MYQDLRSKLAMYKSSQDKKRAQVSKPKDISIEGLEGTVSHYNQMPYFVIEKRYPLNHTYGGFKLGQALDMGMEHLGKVLGENQENLHVGNFLFLDTETTGLSGGTGTVAFLIGAGFFEDESFVVRQYFMRDYDEETAVLGALNQLLAEHGVLVTFNGKSFDWNLLKTRFICNRLRPSCGEPVHIDLLYLSRNIWRLKLQSCRLSSLEENILGEKRTGDIPGCMIPEVYFKYLEDRNVAEIKRVIKHNELDILSLVSLLLKINSLIQNPLKETDDEKELLGIGRIFEKNGDIESVVKCYGSCIDSNDNIIKGIASRRLAGIYKRNGNHTKAADILKKTIDESRTPNIPAMIELAKYYEHREKNLKKALEIVEAATNACLVLGIRNSFYFTDVKKRSDRLKRKMLRLENAKASRI